LESVNQSKMESKTGQKVDPGEWVDKYGDLLYRFAFFRVGEAQVAEDLVQEVLLAAYKSRDRFGGKSAEKTWLVGILKHKIVDYYRNRTREGKTFNFNETYSTVEEVTFDKQGKWKSAPADLSSLPDKKVVDKELGEVIASCVETLPQGIRSVFSLREIDQLTSDEVCKALGITPTNLWVSMHRARLQLRSCLEQEWFEKNKKVS